MTADDLNAPLGQNPQPDQKLPRLPLASALPKLLAGLLGLAVAVFVGWALVVNDPLGGEPVAVVALKPPPAAEKATAASPPPASSAPAVENAASAAQPAAAPPVLPAAPPAGVQTVTIIDGSSGKRQEVVVGASAEPKAAAIGDPRLLEPSRFGLVPKIGAGGLRAADLYARPVAAVSQAAGNTPRIAIVIGCLGIGASATAAALDRLPPAVTLAFVPYGGDLDRMVAAARAAGREVLLQVPMEPFDYPDNDPGPQALLTTLQPAQNIDRLLWSLSRAQAYVGIAGYMGARFSATEASLAPVLKEAARRGLIYFDDGSSARSVAGPTAAAINLPFARADVVIDAVPTPAEINKALAKLEAIARSGGTAVGSASALPVTIERIAQWAKGLEARGIMLVPVSAAAGKPKSS